MAAIKSENTLDPPPPPGVYASHAVPPALILTDCPAPGAISDLVFTVFVTAMDKAVNPVNPDPP